MTHPTSAEILAAIDSRDFGALLALRGRMTTEQRIGTMILIKVRIEGVRASQAVNDVCGVDFAAMVHAAANA